MLFIFSTPVLIRYLWQLKTVVFLHLCLMRTVLLPKINSLIILAHIITIYWVGRYVKGENIEVVLAEFSTLRLTVLFQSDVTTWLAHGHL